MLITKWKLRCTFTEPALGGQATRNVTEKYVHEEARKAGIADEKLEEELDTLEDRLETLTTTFHKDEAGKPIMWDYHLRGFLKSTGSTFNGEMGVSAIKSKIDQYLFVFPRRFPLVMPPGSVITFNERPLRADTAKGPRVALARSEQVPAGTMFECELRLLTPGGRKQKGALSEELVRFLLDYGEYSGMFQWRNASWGRFIYELTAVDGREEVLK